LYKTTGWLLSKHKITYNLLQEGRLHHHENVEAIQLSDVPRNFVQGGGRVQQIQFRTGDRENGDLGAIAP